MQAVAVLDYSDGTVRLYNIPNSVDVLQWLHKHTDYSDDSCYYMVAPFGRPIAVVQYTNNKGEADNGCVETLRLNNGG